MDRWGCVDVPALPLQLLRRRHPAWAGHPVAVVDEDRPQGRILWVDERARRCRVWPGRSYAEGLALAADLRAGVVGEAEIELATAELLQCLRRFTPEVEPRGFAEPGVFWLNASGVEGLYPSLSAWALAIEQGLREAGFAASVVVGFDRFATYALARARRQVLVLDAPQQERELADRVPLHRLDFDPALRDALCTLGIDDIGAFRRLPPGGIRERFGAAAHRLHQLARGARREPLAAEPLVESPCERHDFEPDQHLVDVSGLLLLCKQRLAHVARVLAPQGRTIAALVLRLLFDKAPAREERVQPAVPTLDEVQLADLLRRRLESLRLDDELSAFELRAEAVAATAVQRPLFRDGPRRDLAAGNRALARLRAEFGEAAVVCARLEQGHLPEARFCFRPLAELQPPAPVEVATPRLVRRILLQPRLLAQQRAGEDGWFAHGLGSGPVRELAGPFVISGGWWRREQHRDYYFAETRRGDLLWIYRDRRLRQWRLQGTVE